MVKLNGCFFFIENDELKIYNSIWNKVSNNIKKNLVANPSTIRNY